LPERLRTEYGRRAAGIMFALAVELLLLLALLSLSQSVEAPKKPRLIEVDLSAKDYSEAAPNQPEPEKSKPRPDDRPAPRPVETAAAILPQPMPPPAAVIAPQTAPPAPPPVDRPRPAPPATVIGPAYGPPDTGSHASADSARVGTAPDGSPLYAARWYHEPYDGELRGYLSTAIGPAWGLIACRTAPDFRVEDCVPIAESPGSMMNRAILAAAWQFKVRPPQRGGRSLVGSWVRIRIDYDLKPAKK
jgi:protein TonB